jgi:hypothetical protein
MLKFKTPAATPTKIPERIGPWPTLNMTTAVIAATPPQATKEPFTPIPETPTPTRKDELEAEDDDAAFAISNKMPRTPTKADNSPIDLTMALKKGDRAREKKKKKRNA